jgi:hypothetical protein
MIFAVLTALALSASAPSAAAPVENLLSAYPGQFGHIDGNDLVWADGTSMPISDGIEDKDFDTLLDHPDIDDMFVMPYRAGPPAAVPAFDQDPGRVRYEPLFVKMYGNCARGEVAPHMRNVRWLSGSVRFTTVNGAADRLEEVVADLRKLPADLTRYLVPASGTYNCRTIAGTDRRSMHAYGAAIDINASFSDYWRWAKPVGGMIPYRNRIPFAIADIFERHGFIWGGKSYHYDTMHFEYRPELIGRSSQSP